MGLQVSNVAELAKLGFSVEAIDKASGPLHKVQAAITNTAKTADRSAASFDKATQAANRTVGASKAASQSSLLTTSGQVAFVGASLAAAGAAGAAALAGLYNEAAKNESQFQQLETRLHLTKSALGQLNAASNEYSNGLPGSSDKYVKTAESFALITRETDNLQNAIQATDTAMKLAFVAHGDVADVNRILAQSYERLGNASKPVGPQVAAYGDALESVRADFAINNLDQFATGFSAVAAAATRLKAPVSEAYALVAGLQRDVGPRGAALVGRALGDVLKGNKKTALLGAKLSPGDGLFGALDKIFKQIDKKLPANLREKGLDKVFGAGVGAALIQTRKKLDEYRSAADRAAKATGLLGDNAKKLSNSDPQAVLDTVKQAAGNLAQTLGAKLLPSGMRILKWARDSSAALGAFAMAHPALIATGLLVTAIGSAALIAGGTILTLVGGLGLLLLKAQALGGLGAIVSAGLGPIRIVGAAFAGLITWPVLLGAALVTLATVAYFNWDKIVDAFGSSDRAKATLTKFGDWIATDFTDYVKKGFTDLGEWLATTGWDALTKPFADGSLGATFAGPTPESALGPDMFEGAKAAGSTTAAVVDDVLGNNAPPEPGFRTLDKSGRALQSVVDDATAYWSPPIIQATQQVFNAPPQPGFRALDQSGEVMGAAAAGMKQFWASQILAPSPVVPTIIAQTAAGAVARTESGPLATSGPTGTGSARSSISVDYHPNITLQGTGDTEADVSSIFESEYDKLISRLETDTRRSGFAEYR